MYSFTLAGFVAVTTSCTLLIADNFDDEKYGIHSVIMLVISVSYALFGTTISIFLYGRKNLHLFEGEKKDAKAVEKSVDKPEEEKKEEPEKKSTKVNESEEITNDDEEN